jgi:hypothetical protein
VNIQKFLGIAAFGLTLLAGVDAAHAEGGQPVGDPAVRMPLPFAQRPLTLPKMTLAPELGFNVAHISSNGFSLPTFVNLEAGAHFGITDDFEVGAVALPIRFAPDFGFGNPRLEATYRFLKGDIEMGGRLGVTFITTSGASGVVLEPGLPMLFHLGASARLDLGVFVPLSFGTGATIGGLPTSINSDTTVGLRIPVRFTYNVIPELHIGAQTGLGINDFGDAGNTIYVPLGFVAGYAIPGEKGPLLDIDPYFTFPLFATPGSSGDKINPGFIQAGLTATLYLYL